MQGIFRFLAVGAIAGALVLGIASPALAWHPEGKILKEVQNQTAQTALADANGAANAVAAKPGDVLKYVITISNVGQPDSRGYNDMAKTVMTDTLPTGVELVSDPSKRTITENIGLIKPGQKVAKEYLVKVTSTKDGDVIENEACFTGDSTANDRPQKGCDVADVKIGVPPTTPEKPEQPKETPQVLPATGAGAIVSSVVGAGALVYSATSYLRSRGELAKARKQ